MAFNQSCRGELNSNVLDISTNSMQSVLNPLIEHLTCQLCHQALKDRIRDVTVQWASVKVRSDFVFLNRDLLG